MKTYALRQSVSAALLLCLLLGSQARALDFDFQPPLLEDQVKGVLNTTFTAGVGIRMASPQAGLIAKSDLNPDVCGPPYQSCQGLFRTQVFPSQHLVAAPGSLGANGDQGDLDYRHKYQIFQAPAKLTSDLSLTYKDFGVFARALYFYDFVNDNFTQYHPNEITPQNVNQVGRVGCDFPNSSVSTVLAELQPVLNAVEAIAGPTHPPLVVNPNAMCGRLYGPGGVVRAKRTDGEELAQAGTNIQYLDAYFYGKLPLWGDRTLTFKLGRQLVNWGESTTLVLNSINSTNPVNANNFYRVGTQVEEDFIPIDMVDLSFSPIENFNVEGYYQLEWKPLEAPTPGTYFSSVNVGTNNTGKSVNAGFGQFASDPDCLGKLIDNTLSMLAPSCSTAQRLPDWNPKTWGQFGVKLDYYSNSLNNGTDMALYFENYHSRLPYASLFPAYPSCGRREGNARNNDSRNIVELLLDCPDFPISHSGDPTQATSSALQLETEKFVLEYPENIHLIGASFNTTVGSYSIQGEVAYRPNKPMQVDVHDLAFAALGAQATRCGNIQCEGSTAGIGFGPDGGSAVYGSSNAVNRAGTAYTNDTYDLIVGAAPGAQRSFPNFIIPYRGGTVGENTPCYPLQGTEDERAHGFSGFSHPYYPYDHNSPCYVRGFERMQDFEFNLAATKVIPASDNYLGADQIILAYEWGAEYVPFLPSYDRLVLEGPNSTSGPTAGADGSGADGSRMACSNIPDCSYGADGLRFNAHQQDHAGYPRAFSWGYRVISQFDYEQVLPGITFKPTLIWAQDVGGISPGPAGNFVKGRKSLAAVYEFRYKQSLSLNLGHTSFWGGGAYNVLSDRDFSQVFVKYQF